MRPCIATRFAGSTVLAPGSDVEFLEVWFEARVLQRRDQRIEDIGHGAADDLGFGQWPGVGLVLEGTVAIELELGEGEFGRG